MKVNFFRAVICAALGMGIPGNAVAAEWKRVGSTDKLVSYIDLASIRRSGRYITAWTKWDLTVPMKNGVVLSKHRDAYDCDNQKLRLLASVGYNAAGNVVESFEWSEFENQFKSVVPESIADSAMVLVCSTLNAPPPG